MTYTFLKAQGHSTGKSRVEADKLDEARQLLELAGDEARPAGRPPGRRPRSRPAAETKVVDGSDIPDGWFGIDIGPATDRAIRRRSSSRPARSSGTARWASSRIEPFRHGTPGVAEAMADSPAVTVVGGGETAEAVEQFGFADKVSHVSTGGGAFLECLEGKSFNSLKVIPDR